MSPSTDQRPGTYALQFYLPQALLIRVGSLGQFAFKAGTYLYFGSAHGPGGLAARLGRHMRESHNPHWHVDYLRAVAQIRGIFTTVAPVKLECVWCQTVRQLPAAEVPVSGFGASDCKTDCQAHLIYLADTWDSNIVCQILKTLEIISAPHPASYKGYSPDLKDIFAT